jgi:hypothetical protein
LGHPRKYIFEILPPTMTTELETKNNVTVVKAKKERKSSRTSPVPTTRTKSISSTLAAIEKETSTQYSTLLFEQRKDVYAILKIIDFNKCLQRRVLYEYNPSLDVDSFEPKTVKIDKDATLFQVISNLTELPISQKISSTAAGIIMNASIRPLVRWNIFMCMYLSTPATHRDLAEFKCGVHLMSRRITFNPLLDALAKEQEKNYKILLQKLPIREFKRILFDFGQNFFNYSRKLIPSFKINYYTIIEPESSLDGEIIQLFINLYLRDKRKLFVGKPNDQQQLESYAKEILLCFEYGMFLKNIPIETYSDCIKSKIW